MTLFNITAKNIKRNFQSYFLYFVSMIFSIVVFYVFSSIQYNEQVMMTVGMRTSASLKAGAIAIAIFSAIFMWYSNSFFVRKRKKEIGLYSLLGLEKKQVARMLFYENLIMGAIALGIGVILGSLFSKLFIMLFLNLMGHFVKVDFAISMQAVITTVLVFLLLFFTISLHAYSIIYRFKLVDLFRSEQHAEKEPKASVLIASISVLLIAAGYLTAFNAEIFNNFFIYVISVLGLVILGTYGLFNSFIIFVIKSARNNKPKYYKGMNLIGTSNLLYRIKSNAIMLSIIAVLSATTLTAVGMSYGFYHNINRDITNYFPFSYEYQQKGTRDADSKVDAVLARHPENRLLNSIEIQVKQLDGRIVDSHSETYFDLISETNYNQLAKLKELDTVKLAVNETLLFDSYQYFKDNVSQVKLNNIEQSFSIKEIHSDSLSSYLYYTTLVVKDEVFARIPDNEDSFSVRALTVENQKDSAALSADLEKIFPEYELHSFYSMYTENMEWRGMLMFIGGFLGLVILLATGSIIYFRQLNEASKDQINYQILRNVGVSRKEIKNSIARQLIFVFLFPLIVGISHSWAALMVLSDMIQQSLVTPTIITIAAYTLIYFVYYLLTINSYNKIVNSAETL